MRRQPLFLLFVILLASLFHQKVFAQKDSLIDFLISRIQQHQQQKNSIFPDGLFPSYITKIEKFNLNQPDVSIFFTGLTDYTLMKIRPMLAPDQQVKIDSVIAKSLEAFKHFKNQKGRNTYNFWRTDTITVYPYAGWLFDKSITLPDDMDDTVLSLMVQKAEDSIAGEVHVLMQSFTNNGNSTLRNIIKQFDTIPAYSTWFGKKFPVVFDVSVLSNILTFVQSYNLQWTKADSASLRMIVKTIENDYHWNKAIYVSPYYPKTALILYHISRLMQTGKIPQLEQLKVKMIADAAIGIKNSDNLMEKIIYASAILGWGYLPPEIPLPSVKEVVKEVEQNDFSFFVGNIPSYFPDHLKTLATENKLGMFYHYCPAFYEALLLEYILLRNS